MSASRIIAVTACGLMLLSATPVARAEQAQDGVAATADRNDAAAGWDRYFRQAVAPDVRPSSSFPARCAERLVREGLLKPGSKVLVLAMGDGRNAVYFAGRGLDVTGLDISSVAIEKAEKAAADRGVELESVKADLFKQDLGDGQWDLVTNIYFNPAIRILDRIKRAVRPGGFLLIEGQGSEYEGNGPPQWSRFEPNQLLEALEGWRILEYQDGVFPSEWAEARSIPVVRVLAMKPLSAD